MKKFSAEALWEYCKEVFLAVGVEESCAKTVADMLIDAETTGVTTHGVSRMSIYVERLEKGLVSKNNNAKIIRESPAVAVVDAANTLGAPAAKFAMETCIRKAKTAGCCFATVKGSNHFGTGAFYAKMAAKENMIGFVCTNVTGKIAPFGSSTAFLGTNPFCVSIPSNDMPVVLDMTPTVVALGKLIMAQKMGQQIPLGWALDKDGKPTIDPEEGRKGSLVPIGGPKGSGIAVIIEILCGILSGAGTAQHLHDLYSFDAPQGIGHFVGAIDVSQFMDVAAFKDAVSQLAAEIKALKPAEGFSSILMPGERELDIQKQRMVEGIEVPDVIYEELVNLGKPYGLTL